MLTEEEFKDLQIHFLRHETQCEERWKTVFSRLDDIDDRINKLFQIVLAGGATTILFLLGGRLVYYLIMPLAIKFFLSFESLGAATNLPIQLEAKVNEYLSLVMKLIFAFGLSFQLPVVLSLLARIGVVNSTFLKERRKYVVVIIFAAAAVLTPPDPITQIGLGIPLLILYELSIISVGIIEKKLEEKNAQY